MSQRDDFWDISKLLPKDNVRYVQSPKTDTSTVPVEFGNNTSPEVKSALFENAVRDGALKAAKEYSYTPSNTLFTSITVRPRLSPSRLYADFITDAKKYLYVHGSKCESVPFPAYVPEYRSMKRAQLNFYFYFRDCVKSGVKIDAPQSYILLLLFEIINLPDEIEPQYGASLICRIGQMYSKDHVRLLGYVSQWLCDYCLIHRLDLPQEAWPMAQELAALSELPEFYYNPLYTDRYTLLCLAAHYLPDADSKDSACAELMREHLVNAIDRLAVSKTGRAFSVSDMQTLTTGARTAYRSALCSYSNNALISYTYKRFSKPSLLSSRLEDACKYAENRVRAYLGIRARLKCPTLADADKRILDEYFDQALPVQKKKYERKVPVSYTGENEHLYEPESKGISFDAACAIEKESWRAAEMLEAAFADEEYQVESVCDDSRVQDYTQDAQSRLNEAELEFIRHTLNKDIASLKAMLKSRSLIGDAVCERINEYAFDTIGDSVIESTDGNYNVIEDYLEEVEAWLTN